MDAVLEAVGLTKHFGRFVALRDCDLFVAIGTSGTVEPASSLVRWAELTGARRILLNLEVFDGARGQFTECHAGPADDLVPQWFGTP